MEPEERGRSDVAAAVDGQARPAHLAAELARQGHEASARARSRDLLRAEGFSLQGNAKTIEGISHPDRDAQFRYINEPGQGHQAAGDPVISVDTKKKELVGEFANAGRQWRPKGDPGPGPRPRLPSDSEGKAIPYGVYDLTANAGWVDRRHRPRHRCVRRGVGPPLVEGWPARLPRRPQAADHRRRRRVQRLPHPRVEGRAWPPSPLETGLEITVCHFPPGTQCRCLTN